MRTRLYALTDPMDLNRIDTKYVMDGNRLEDYQVSHVYTSEELAFHAAWEADQLHREESPLLAFTELEAAKEYAKERHSYRREPFLGYIAAESAIVEIFVDNKHIEHNCILKQEKISSSETVKPKNPDKTYTFYEMENKPENYVTFRTWIKDSKPYVRYQAPTGHNRKFFEKEADLIKSVQALFHDYHSPRLFSCHWRHHKNDARKITDFLTSTTTPEDAYEFLFKERQRIIIDNKKLNMSGTYMLSLEYALKKIRYVMRDKLERVADKKLECKI